MGLGLRLRGLALFLGNPFFKRLCASFWGLNEMGHFAGDFFRFLGIVTFRLGGYVVSSLLS